VRTRGRVREVEGVIGEADSSRECDSVMVSNIELSATIGEADRSIVDFLGLAGVGGPSVASGITFRDVEAAG
jgi:hypothetical protein